MLKCENRSNDCCGNVDACVSHDGFTEGVRVTDRPLIRDMLHELVDLWFVDSSRGLDVLANSHLTQISYLVSESRV